MNNLGRRQLWDGPRPHRRHQSLVVEQLHLISSSLVLIPILRAKSISPPTRHAHRQLQANCTPWDPVLGSLSWTRTFALQIEAAKRSIFWPFGPSAGRSETFAGFLVLP